MNSPPRSTGSPQNSAAALGHESTYSIRSIAAEEWPKVRALRLAALQDGVAHLAFLETHADALAKPDSFWRERAASAASTAGPTAAARQFVAVHDDGPWVGTAVVLLEVVGERDILGQEITVPGAQLVGIYVQPAHRGRGVVEQLVDACFAWARARELGVARLFVHVDNERARRVYRRLGFVPTGDVFSGPQGREAAMAKTLESAEVTAN